MAPRKGKRKRGKKKKKGSKATSKEEL